jgi:hypothetical protein
MIQANELRIGNKLNYLIIDRLDERKEWYEETTIDYEDISLCVDSNDYFNKHYAPIPLTEEWLLKFGAIKYETPHDNQYRIGDRLFVIREGIIYDYGTNVKLEFVHRFQNFMYELTNEELTINQP